MIDIATELLSAIPHGTFYAVAGGLAVSVLLQIFKNWLQLQSDKVISLLLLVMSFIPVAIQYVTSTVSQNPTILGQRTMVIMSVASILYRYLVKPATNVIQDAKTLRNIQSANIATALPDGLPNMSAPVQPTDPAEFQA